MTDEAKALVERLRGGWDGWTTLTEIEAADLIENQAREIERLGVIAQGNASIVCKILDEKDAEIERLREALEAYAAHCSICSGGGSIVEEDSATGALLWRDCPGCTPARAALAGDSHDQ